MPRCSERRIALLVRRIVLACACVKLTRAGAWATVERALEARIKAERQRMHATGLADDAKAELMVSATPRSSCTAGSRCGDSEDGEQEAESWFRSITRHGHQVEAMKKLPEDMLKAMKPEVPRPAPRTPQDEP